MKNLLSTLVFFFICIAILFVNGFANDIPNPNAEQTESVKQTEMWPFFPWGGHPQFPIPGGPWTHPGNGWALPPLPAHKFPPFTWPKPGNGWALPPLPAHKFPPFTWPKPGNGWALPPLPAHKFPPFAWPKPGNGWALPPLPAHKFPPFTWPKPGNGWALPPLPAHKFPPFTWPKPGNGWAFPPLPAHKFPPFPWGHASSTQSSESPNKCWSSLQEVEGCVNDIVSSFWAGKFNVGQSCCKAFTDIKDDCSINGSGAFDVPFFHQALQHHCSSQVAPPSKA